MGRVPKREPSRSDRQGNAILFLLTRIGAFDERLSGFAFYLTNATYSRILKMKKYSITEAAELVGVNRATLYRWIQRKLVPAPLVEVVAGVEITYWAESELAKGKEYKRTKYWGQGKKKSKAKRTKKSES